MSFTAKHQRPFFWQSLASHGPECFVVFRQTCFFLLPLWSNWKESLLLALFWVKNLLWICFTWYHIPLRIQTDKILHSHSLLHKSDLLTLKLKHWMLISSPLKPLVNVTSVVLLTCNIYIHCLYIVHVNEVYSYSFNEVKLMC